MRDPFDLRVGEHVAEELKFGGAGLTVPGRHCPDGATVQRHLVAAVGKLVEVGQIPLAVEDLGQDAPVDVSFPVKNVSDSGES